MYIFVFSEEVSCPVLQKCKQFSGFPRFLKVLEYQTHGFKAWKVLEINFSRMVLFQKKILYALLKTQRNSANYWGGDGIAWEIFSCELMHTLRSPAWTYGEAVHLRLKLLRATMKKYLGAPVRLTRSAYLCLHWGKLQRFPTYLQRVFAAVSNASQTYLLIPWTQC